MHNFTHPIIIGNYWLLCEVMIFPEHILKLIRLFGELHLGGVLISSEFDI